MTAWEWNSTEIQFHICLAGSSLVFLVNQVYYVTKLP